MKRRCVMLFSMAIMTVSALAYQGTAFAAETSETESIETETAEPEETEEGTQDAHDFKTFDWGMSKEDIIAVEGEPESTGEMDAYDAEYIVYERSLCGMDALLAYYFCEGGFFEARYIMTETHSNDSLYIEDYEKIRSALTKKYGDPLLDYEDWENDSKKNYYEDKKGDALSYGYLSYITYYYLDSISVEMGMSADNYQVTTSINFKSQDITPGEADYSSDF